MAETVQIVDLDIHEPTDAEIVSWHEMMTAPDQLLWEYDESWAKEPSTQQEEVDSFRQRRAKQRGQNHPLWAMVNGCVVGMIGINRFENLAQRHCAGLGFGVIAEYARQGIGYRLLMAAIDKARQLGLARLQADCFADNAASIALLSKCRFREEGVRIRAICKDGRFRDQTLFGLML